MRLILLTFCALIICRATGVLQHYGPTQKPRKWTLYRNNYPENYVKLPTSQSTDPIVFDQEPTFYASKTQNRLDRHTRNTPDQQTYQSDSSASVQITRHDESSRAKDLLALTEPLPVPFVASRKETKVCRSCGVPVLQDSYCKEDFVVKAYVLNVTKSPVEADQYLYAMYIYQVYKDVRVGSFSAYKFQNVIYHCDKFQAGFRDHETYLFSGTYGEHGQAFVDSCSWKRSASNVSPLQWRLLVRRYARTCPLCKIERVFNYNRRLHLDPKKCYLSVDPRHAELTCRDRHSICRPHEAKCQFVQTARYEECVSWRFR